MPFLGESLSVGAALFWAIGVVLFKRSGERMPPVALNLFKNTVALALLLPTMALFGEAVAPPDRPLRDWLALLASGFVGIAVADTMFFFSLERLGAGLTAVVDTSYTPIMLLLSFAVLGEAIGWPVLLGAALIVTGLLVGSWEKPPPGIGRRDIAVGAAVGILGIALMGFSVVMIKDLLNRTPELWATFVRILGGAVGLVPMVLLSRKRRAYLAALAPSASWKFAVPAAVFGTYLALGLWIAGMKYAAVSVATLFNQLSTVFIFLLATLFLKEKLTWRRMTAIALSFGGAAVVVVR